MEEKKTSNQLTREEKEDLVSKVSDLLMRDVLRREDTVIIMEVCSNACSRRISELERAVPTPGQKVQ